MTTASTLKSPKLSVIIPVFNEAARLYNLKQVIHYLDDQPYASELIVVNDGSSDDTLTQLRALNKKHDFKLLTYSVNRGKGHAIATGMAVAQGKWQAFLDVDLSVPLHTLAEALKVAEKADVVIGTRRSTSSNVKVRQDQVREQLGRLFTLFSRWWLNVDVSDFTCGFKVFTAAAAKDIFPRTQIKRWGGDAEILRIIKERGYTVVELPVTWKNDPRTKVKFPQDLWRSVHELFLIRYHSLRGRYR